MKKKQACVVIGAGDATGGAIDTDFIRGVMPDIDQQRADDAILSPDAIAENYLMLRNQPRSAWTHELDLRPLREKC